MVKIVTDKVQLVLTPVGNMVLGIKSETGKVYEILMGTQGAERLGIEFSKIAQKMKGRFAFNMKADHRTNLALEDSAVAGLAPFDETKPGFRVGVSEDREFVTVRFSFPPSRKGAGTHVDLALPAQDAGVLIASLQASYALLDPEKAPRAN